MIVEELGFEQTPLGELTLRRRLEPRFGNQAVFEVKLGEEYLMSSLFTESERQLATLGLEPLQGDLDVAIGGLGLGFTAVEALKNTQVSSLLVIDLFQAVIDWHHAGLVPNGAQLTCDPRCELRQGDYFELARTGFDALAPDRKFDAVLLDIDHSPHHHLDSGNASLYTKEGLSSVKDQLRPNGTYAIWSNDPASGLFTNKLREVFATAKSHDIAFPNPYTGARSTNSVYVAQKDGTLQT
jgi:spermidine synthase